jgi:hypothetical protein
MNWFALICVVLCCVVLSCVGLACVGLAKRSRYNLMAVLTQEEDDLLKQGMVSHLLFLLPFFRTRISAFKVSRYYLRCLDVVLYYPACVYSMPIF